MSEALTTEALNARSRLFGAAHACLVEADADAKIALTRQTAAAWRSRSRASASIGDASPSCDESCVNVPPGLPAAVRLVDPRTVPRRRLRSEKGRAAFIHAIAHIEFNAINLAWDCVHRFRDLPEAYYDDWVRVAGEEAEHFDLLRKRLGELGFAYGDFDTHDGLWEMAARTADDLVARMAMVPRVLEARGLDVTPAMITRFEQADDEATAAILRLILEEEVGHVAVGSRWFRYACTCRDLEPVETFSQMVRTHLSGGPKPPFNIDARGRAGFEAAELEMLEELGAGKTAG